MLQVAGYWLQVENLQLATCNTKTDNMLVSFAN